MSEVVLTVLAIFGFLGVIFGVPALIIFLCARNLKKDERFRGIFEKQEPKKPVDWNEPVAEPEWKTFSAKIISRRVFNRFTYRMITTAESNYEYYLTFLTSEWEKEFPVPEEIFLKYMDGEEGILTTVNELFFDFRREGEEEKEIPLEES